MKKDLTRMIFVPDKSGSMSGLEKDTIGGFNSLIEKQRKESGEAKVTTVLFNDRVAFVHDNADIKDVPLLTSKEYYVCGCTAMLDAIGSVIKKAEADDATTSENEKAEKTVVIITTDGMENSSKEFSYENVRKLIDAKKEDGWEFIFLGANIDVESEASKLGIDKDNSVTYRCDSQGVETNYECLDMAMKEIRQYKTLSARWKEGITDRNNKKK